MQKFIGKLLDSRWPALGWTLLIFLLLTIRLGSLENVPMLGIPNFDKLVHAILFGVLVFLWWRYLYGRQAETALGRLVLIFTLASAFGIGMEFYQKYFTSREFEIGDIYADTAGAAISAFICSYIKK